MSNPRKEEQHWATGGAIHTISLHSYPIFINRIFKNRIIYYYYMLINCNMSCKKNFLVYLSTIVSFFLAQSMYYTFIYTYKDRERKWGSIFVFNVIVSLKNHRIIYINMCAECVCVCVRVWERAHVPTVAFNYNQSTWYSC